MSYDSTILAESNLVAYYKLAANGNDSSSNAFNGTTSGTVTFGQTALALGLGQCALFDGSTGHIALPVGVNIAEPISIECWIHDHSLASDGCFFANNANNGGGAGWAVSWYHGGGDIAFVQGGNNTFMTANAFASGVTYYICLTIDTSHNYTLYAGKVGTDSAPSQWGTMVGVAPGYGLGCNIADISGGGRAFTGYESSLAVYNKVLSGPTMNSHYTLGTTAPSSTKLRISDGYGGIFV